MRVQIDHQGAGFVLANMRALRDTLRVAFNDVCVDIAGTDRIECDWQFCVIGAQCPDHPDDAVFRCAIGMRPFQSPHPSDG